MNIRCIAAAALCALAWSMAIAAPVTVRVIAINDFHGHLQAGELSIRLPDPASPGRTIAVPAGGAAHLAALVKRLRSEQRASVFVSSGDLVGASPLISGLFHDEPTIEVMNAIGLDINAVGNHEFDRGAAELRRLINGGCLGGAPPDRPSCNGREGPFRGARFDVIGANVIDSAGRSWLPPTAMRAFGAVRVGFIGAVTRSTPGIVMPHAVAGLRFVDEAEAINAHAKRLKDQGAHAVIAIVHEGGDTDGGINDCGNPRGPIFDIVKRLDPIVDVVLSGHTHRAYRCNIDGRWVLQAASFGRLVAVVDLKIDPSAGLLRDQTEATNIVVANRGDRGATSVASPGNGLARTLSTASEDAAVAAIVAHYDERARPIAERPIGRIASAFDRRQSAGGDHALGRLIADAQLHATRAQGAQIAFTNPGGVRSDLRPRRDGSISYADAYAVQPFGNTLVTLTLTGAQLRTLLEQQWSSSRPERERGRMLQPSRGFNYAWSASRPHGERVIADSMRLDGQRIDAHRLYRITVNDYLATGGDAFRVLREGRDVVGGPLDVDALAAYLAARGDTAPLAPDRSARIARRR